VFLHQRSLTRVQCHIVLITKLVFSLRDHFLLPTQYPSLLPQHRSVSKKLHRKNCTRSCQKLRTSRQRKKKVQARRKKRKKYCWRKKAKMIQLTICSWKSLSAKDSPPNSSSSIQNVHIWTRISCTWTVRHKYVHRIPRKKIGTASLNGNLKKIRKLLCSSCSSCLTEIGTKS